MLLGRPSTELWASRCPTLTAWSLVLRFQAIRFSSLIMMILRSKKSKSYNGSENSNSNSDNLKVRVPQIGFTGQGCLGRAA